MSRQARSALVALAIFCFAVCAEAQTRTLALYVGSGFGLEADAEQSAQLELKRLLAPAGVEAVWKDFGRHDTSVDVQAIAVSSFEGSCSVSKPAAVQRSSVETQGVLADTSISNGHVLPFFRIDCARLVRLLTPELQPLDAPQRRALFGRALARVIAHELYHILAKTSDHQARGVAKPRFSMYDLTGSSFDFDLWSLILMRPMPAQDAAVSANH